MKKTFIGIAILVAAYLLQSGLSTFAAELDAEIILNKMKAALEPGVASTSSLNFFIKDHHGKVTNTWIAREARSARQSAQ